MARSSRRNGPISLLTYLPRALWAAVSHRHKRSNVSAHTHSHSSIHSHSPKQSALNPKDVFLSQTIPLESENECAICLCDMPTGCSRTVCRTECKHSFHSHCLAQWQRRGSHCPVCWTTLSGNGSVGSAVGSPLCVGVAAAVSDAHTQSLSETLTQSLTDSHSHSVTHSLNDSHTHSVRVTETSRERQTSEESVETEDISQSWSENTDELLARQLQWEEQQLMHNRQ